jgi:hypothetical protein
MKLYFTLLGTSAKFLKPLFAFVMSVVLPSVHMEQLCSEWTDFRVKIVIRVFFENPSRKFRFN